MGRDRVPAILVREVYVFGRSDDQIRPYGKGRLRSARGSDVAPLGENSIGCIRLCRTGSAPSRVLGAV